VFNIPFTVSMPFAKIVLVVAAIVKGVAMANRDCPPLIHKASTWAFVSSVIEP